ncbi:MAG: hypothetical protein HYS62_00270 [Candidatus Aenigmarchaeota archaeon]|nr:hypothetical protein [Candidatus Aenigmarchaeota archaeon]
MPSSMKQFILRKLKENVPLSEIRKDLKAKGYAIEQINKAVREAIGGMDKKISSGTMLQLAVIVVGVVIAVGVAVYFTYSPKSVFSQCNIFSNEIKICENAVRSALEKYSGNLQSVDKRSISAGEERLPTASNYWI